MEIFVKSIFLNLLTVWHDQRNVSAKGQLFQTIEAVIKRLKKTDTTTTSTLGQLLQRGLVDYVRRYLHRDWKNVLDLIKAIMRLDIDVVRSIREPIQAVVSDISNKRGVGGSQMVKEWHQIKNSL